MSSIQFDEYPIAFLYVLPITEEELSFFDSNGPQALEKQLLGKINPYDLERKSLNFNEIIRKKETMEKKELLKLSRYLEKKFQGDADFSSYGNALSCECPVVDIITTKHPDHVTYIGTIGCSLLPIRRSKDEVEDWRIEFVTAINEDSEDIMTKAMLSLISLMNSLENNCCYPGLVVRNTFPEDCPSQMKHLLLVYPFLWEEGLESISVKKTQIRFLQLMPISDAEADFIDIYGYDAFDDKMIEQEVLYNDFYRSSCV